MADPLHLPWHESSDSGSRRRQVYQGCFHKHGDHKQFVLMPCPAVALPVQPGLPGNLPTPVPKGRCLSRQANRHPLHLQTVPRLPRPCRAHQRQPRNDDYSDRLFFWVAALCNQSLPWFCFQLHLWPVQAAGRMHRALARWYCQRDRHCFPADRIFPA